MSINYDHLSIPQALLVQEELRSQLRIENEGTDIRSIAGADISFNKFSQTVYAGITVLSYPYLAITAYALVKMDVKFPYVPRFLAFREVPALLRAWELLPEKPDMLVVDGHGIAHPRRLGIASHFGALTGQRTIGCAKKLLFGTYTDPGPKKGDYSILRELEEPIGHVLRTKDKVAPVYISPGHRVGFDEALSIMLSCVRKHRIPEPTRWAHEIVNKFRTGELLQGYHSLDAPHLTNSLF